MFFVLIIYRLAVYGLRDTRLDYLTTTNVNFDIYNVDVKMKIIKQNIIIL